MEIMKKSIFPMLIAFVPMLGCSQPAVEITGVWVTEHDGDTETLQFNPDESFTIRWETGRGTADAAGAYSLSGRSLTLVFENGETLQYKVRNYLQNRNFSLYFPRTGDTWHYTCRLTGDQMAGNGGYETAGNDYSETAVYNEPATPEYTPIFGEPSRADLTLLNHIGGSWRCRASKETIKFMDYGKAFVVDSKNDTYLVLYSVDGKSLRFQDKYDTSGTFYFTGTVEDINDKRFILRNDKTGEQYTYELLGPVEMTGYEAQLLLSYNSLIHTLIVGERN